MDFNYNFVSNYIQGMEKESAVLITKLNDLQNKIKAMEEEKAQQILLETNRGKLKEIRTFITNNKEKIEGVDIAHNKGWEFLCNFDVIEEDKIYLWDFKQSGTFNLIRKENRLKSINTHLDDFEYVISNLFS